MKSKFLLILAVLLSTTSSLSAQDSRAYIKEQIREWGSCRNVAITLTGGDLALNGKNAYAASGVPDGLLKALKELNDEGEFIDDVQLTEGGRWLILYGDNGFRWNDIPASLEKKQREYNENEEVVTSVTFNDKGGWIIISTEHISASNTGVYDWIEEGMDKYGALWAAHMTNEALILCYENGFRHSGNIPEKVKRKLGETNIDVYRIKFLSDGCYFIADKEGRYEYYM